jgi:hypothetical protein
MRDTVFLTRHRSDDKLFVIRTMTILEEAWMAAGDSDDQPGIESAVAAVLATAQNNAAGATDLLDALVLLRWAHNELAAVEPTLIRAARAAGASWQQLAPALGVASRQAAERRYLRLSPASADEPDSTREGRVRAERDRRAGHRAVAQWAYDNTADLRRLAGQVTALTDLGDDAAQDVGRLHRALADTDATALPALLADAHRHLGGHPDLAGQIDIINADTDRVLRQTQQRRDSSAPADEP